jgi:hypothetical protein
MPTHSFNVRRRDIPPYSGSQNTFIQSPEHILPAIQLPRLRKIISHLLNKESDWRKQIEEFA